MARKDMTQLLIADALKQLSCTKPLSKITVMDITRACGINRSTFYYHFIDKDDVIEWIFRYDIEDHYISVFDGGWKKNIRHGLTAFQQGASFYQQALDLEGVHNLRKAIYLSAYKRYLEIVEHPECLVPELQECDMDALEKRLTAEFYSHGLSTMCFQYIQSGAHESVDDMMDFVDDMTVGLKNTLIAIAQRKRVEN